MKRRHVSIALIIAIVTAGSTAVVASAAAPWPHHEEIAPGVHVIGFADRFRSANCGFLVEREGTWLVDLPRGIEAERFLADVKRVSGKPAIALLLTHATREDAAMVDELRRLGVKRVYLTPATYKSLTAIAHPSKQELEAAATPAAGYEIIRKRQLLGGVSGAAGGTTAVEFLPWDECATAGAAAVFLPATKVFFAGPLVYHGPRVPLAGTDTAVWREALGHLAVLHPAHVVPGFGTWGSGEIIDRQRRFLAELRRQVGYFIAQGQPHDDLQRVVRLVPDYLVWMPYDTPLAEDVEHVYQELTVPHAPFNGKPPQPNDDRPHAFVLIGDQPHEPGHIEEGLRPCSPRRAWNRTSWWMSTR